MDTLSSLRVFRLVAELKGFSAAARRSGLSPAMVSKHIAHLEKRLGSRLFNRTSRHVSLTEAGKIYYRQITHLLDDLDEVEATVGNVTTNPRGTLKLSMPVWLANTFFAEGLADYQRRYPDVQLDVDVSGRRVNLIEEGFDLALRATANDELAPGLIARPLTEAIFLLVASPAYLERNGSPARLDELENHALLRYNGINWDGSLPMHESAHEQSPKVRLRPVLSSDNETLLYLSAIAGMGMSFLPLCMIDADLKAGRLEAILPHQLRFKATLYAIYSNRKYLSAKVRTFIDFWSERLRAGDKA